MTQKTAAEPASGDVVVTRIAHRYHIGWVEAIGKSISALAVRNDEDEAFALACKVRPPGRRVFLYGGANSAAYVQIACADFQGDTQVRNECSTMEN
jgi:hypothetical protein